MALAAAAVLLCSNIGFGQDSRFETPDLKPNLTLGGLSLGDARGEDETEGLESIEGEAVPGSSGGAGLRVPDFNSRYGPVGGYQSGGSLGSGDQNPILQPPQQETLGQSQVLPNQYQGEFIYPDN